MNKEDLQASMRRRNFEVTWVETRQDALALLLKAISPGSRVAWGGSVTLNEVGIKEALILRDDIVVLNRDAATSAEEKHRIQIETFGSDFYLLGTNAMTADGKLVNIDGMGNRLAALIYGPRVVYVVAGINKICATEQEALARVRQMAAPANVRRLGRDTPCAVSGHCHDCLSDDCVCSHIVITRRSWVPGRIRIILVDEVLGI
jgi:hypothetical protein